MFDLSSRIREVEHAMMIFSVRRGCFVVTCPCGFASKPSDQATAEHAWERHHLEWLNGPLTDRGVSLTEEEQ